MFSIGTWSREHHLELMFSSLVDIELTGWLINILMPGPHPQFTIRLDLQGD